jgi:hypothetical protein
LSPRFWRRQGGGVDYGTSNRSSSNTHSLKSQCPAPPAVPLPQLL